MATLIPRYGFLGVLVADEGIQKRHLERWCCFLPLWPGTERVLEGWKQILLTAGMSLSSFHCLAKVEQVGQTHSKETKLGGGQSHWVIFGEGQATKGLY